MSANRVAVHEIDGRRMHMVVDGLVEGGDVVDVAPLRSAAYRRAAALLSIYRSRVDFLKHGEIERGTEDPYYRFKHRPVC